MMKKRKIITKYLVPVLFALLVAVAFVVGIFYIRSYMVKQTAKELGLPKNVVYDIALKDSDTADN